VRTVVDVGGGTGAMLAELLRARPAIRGTLSTFADRGTRERDVSRGGVADRVTSAARASSIRCPPGADIYLLRGVINDWPRFARRRRSCAVARRLASNDAW